VACTAAEIDDKPLGRRICNQPVVLFRGPQGEVAALEDWCPHRGAPLSLGRVIEGRLVCGYHGLEIPSSTPSRRDRASRGCRTPIETSTWVFSSARFRKFL
jgi:vanillate O-demethylase monooxygenase subunit